MSYRIFLVEDEPNLNRLLATYLEKEGWDVTTFTSGGEAIEVSEAQSQRPDLWILDIMLPDVDGFALIRQIKKEDATVPVIFISARDQDLDRIVGLEMGSDDYLAKPFLPRELVIRVRKLLERVYASGYFRQGSGRDTSKGVADAGEQGAPSLPEMVHHQAISCGPYVIAVRTRGVYEQGERIDLTSKEFDLVHHLVTHVGVAFSREQLLNALWGADYFGSDRVVDDLVRRIRKKLPKLPVETMYGYGYRMVHFS